MTERSAGIEEELLLVRPAGGLAAVGEAVVRVAAERHDAVESEAGNPPFDHELKQEQVELGTSPHTDLGELAAELLTLRKELAAAADGTGAQLVAAGASPGEAASTTTDSERYHRMMDEFGIVARKQLTCGMHVHVGVDSPEEGVAVLDRLRPWLALLTALSTNSPLFDGQDTGYASYRSLLWGQWPTAGPVDVFETVAGYEQARADLIASGAALDDGMIYFDARLSAKYPTVEVRVADVTPRVVDAVTIAALVRAMVESAARRWHAGEPVTPVRTELLRAAGWRAARWGMRGELVDTVVGAAVSAWDLVDAAIEWCGEALADRGDMAAVRWGLSEIRRRGTGADLQRQALAERGRVDDVITAIGREMLIEPAPGWTA